MPRLVYRCVVQLISVAAPAPAVCTGLWCVGPTPLQPLVTTAAAQHQYGECGLTANWAHTEYRDGDHSDSVDIAASVSVWEPGRERGRGRG